MSEREKRLAFERHQEVMRLIQAAEARILEIEALFSDPSYYQRTPLDEVRRLENERAGLEEELARLMAEWEQEEERLQALG
jgi:hypothetical protein